jgi:hypothetical protein
MICSVTRQTIPISWIIAGCARIVTSYIQGRILLPYLNKWLHRHQNIHPGIGIRHRRLFIFDGHQRLRCMSNNHHYIRRRRWHMNSDTLLIRWFIFPKTWTSCFIVIKIPIFAKANAFRNYWYSIIVDITCQTILIRCIIACFARIVTFYKIFIILKYLLWLPEHSCYPSS